MFDAFGNWIQPPPSNVADPQSLQNMMRQGNQLGYGQNNSFMNPYGAQGIPSNVGFQGFAPQLGYPDYNPQGGYPQPSPQAPNPNLVQQYQAPAPLSYQTSATNPYDTKNQGPQYGYNAGAVSARMPSVQTQSPQFPQSSYQPQTTSGIATPPAGFSPQAQPPIQTQPKQLSMLPSTIKMSDETAKKHIVSGESDVQEFLDALHAYSYEYKDKKFGEGTHISPMAQELEQSKLGKEQIINTPEGKMVNYGGRLPAIQLAATAMLNHKLNKLEATLTKALKERIIGRKNGK